MEETNREQPVKVEIAFASREHARLLAIDPCSATREQEIGWINRIEACMDYQPR